MSREFTVGDYVKTDVLDRTDRVLGKVIDRIERDIHSTGSDPFTIYRVRVFGKTDQTVVAREPARLTHTDPLPKPIEPGSRWQHKRSAAESFEVANVYVSEDGETQIRLEDPAETVEHHVVVDLDSFIGEVAKGNVVHLATQYEVSRK